MECVHPSINSLFKIDQRDLSVVSPFRSVSAGLGTQKKDKTPNIIILFCLKSVVFLGLIIYFFIC